MKKLIKENLDKKRSKDINYDIIKRDLRILHKFSNYVLKHPEGDIKIFANLVLETIENIENTLNIK